MKIKTFQGGYDKNLSYLIYCEETKIAAIIDPAVASTPIFECIERLDLILTKILITHTHHDHYQYLSDFLQLPLNEKKKLSLDSISQYLYKLNIFSSQLVSNKYIQKCNIQELQKFISKILFYLSIYYQLLYVNNYLKLNL